MNGVFHVITFVLTIYLTDGYPSGADVLSCDNGLPMHKQSNGKMFQPQTDPSPYYIKVNSTIYFPGDRINVEIKTSIGAKPFKGFLIQVKTVRSHLRSQYTLPPPGFYDTNDFNVKILSCHDLADAMTHTNSNTKYGIDLQWITPRYATEDIYVEATVLTDYRTFWLNITSDVIRLFRGDVLQAERLEVPLLTEIIETVKARENVERRRELTSKRFGQGLNDTLDSKGYTLTPYIVNILPFNTSYMGTGLIKINNLHGAIQTIQEIIELRKSSGNSVLRNPAEPQALQRVVRHDVHDIQTNISVTMASKKATNESSFLSEELANVQKQGDKTDSVLDTAIVPTTDQDSVSVDKSAPGNNTSYTTTTYTTSVSSINQGNDLSSTITAVQDSTTTSVQTFETMTEGKESVTEVEGNNESFDAYMKLVQALLVDDVDAAAILSQFVEDMDNVLGGF